MKVIKVNYDANKTLKYYQLLDIYNILVEQFSCVKNKKIKKLYKYILNNLLKLLKIQT